MFSGVCSVCAGNKTLFLWYLSLFYICCNIGNWHYLYKLLQVVLFIFKYILNLYSVEVMYIFIYFICQLLGSALTILFTNKNIPDHQHLSAETLGYIAHLIQTALLLHHCRKCHIEYFLLLIFL